MSIDINAFAGYWRHDEDVQHSMTTEEFARRIGMSARNIRAHQARGLLPRPLRHGRRVFYLDQHVRRAEDIKELQRQGFNLVAIASMMGAGEAGQEADAMAVTLRGLETSDPDALEPLLRHRIVAWSAGGGVRIAHPGPVKAALALRQLGMSLPAAILMLGKVLDAVAPVVREYLLLVSSGIASSGSPDAASPASPATARTQAAIALLSETVRVTLENAGAEIARPAPPAR